MIRTSAKALLLFLFATTGCLGDEMTDPAASNAIPPITGSVSVPVADDTESAKTKADEQPPHPAEDGRRMIAEGDWPQFLGPHETGVSDETGHADRWPDAGPPVVWSIDIGTGYSAPSILGKRLVVHHRRGDREIVECLDTASGTSLWTHDTPTDFVDPYGYNGGPRCSPLLTSDRCYTFGAGGTLCCVDLATGQELWRRDTAREFAVPEGFFGVGASPVLYGNLLIVLVGGQPNSGVVAFDAATGKTVWQAVGKATWDGAELPNGRTYEWTGDEMLVSYASPIVATIDGTDHCLCLMRQGLVSLDPQTGAERFHYWFRSSVHESVNAARPVVDGDRVLLTAAYRTGAALLQVRKDGCDEIWRDRANLECHWSTPIVQDGYAYGFSGRHENEGELRCIDLKTGEVRWEVDGSESVRDSLEVDRRRRGFVDRETQQPAPWPYMGRGSKILADGKAIILGERGTLFLAELSPEGYRELARCAAPEIGYPAWAAPVLSRGRLYLRDEDSLVCLDVSKTIEP